MQRTGSEKEFARLSSFVVLALVAAAIGSLLSCSRSQKQVKPAPSPPSNIKVQLQDGGPIVLTTSTAEFRILHSGFVQATLLKDGTRLSLDEPGDGSSAVGGFWVLNFDKILQMFGTRGILAGAAFTVFGYGIGHLFGGPGIDTKRVLALGTAQRNIAAALVVGGQSFSDPRVVVMVVVVANVAFLILMPLAYTLTKRAKTQRA